MKLFTAIYAFLLRFVPGDFRTRYGDSAADLAATRVRDAGQRSRRVRQAMREIGDLILLAIRGQAGRRPGGSSRAAQWRAALDGIRQEIQLAARAMRRNPLASLLVIATLAGSMAAATTTVSVLSAVVLRPLPIADPGQLVLIRGTREGRSLAALSAPEWRDVQRQTASLVDAGGMWETNGTLAAGGDVVPAHLAWVTSNFFQVLGVTPVLGRHFTAEEDAMRGPRTAILSHRVWQRHFNGDPAVIGRTIRLDDQPRTIVGVMPDGFAHYEGNITISWNRFDLWIPNADWPNRDMRFLRTVGRLRDGRTVADVNRDLEAIGRAWDEGRLSGAAAPRLFARAFEDELLGGTSTVLGVLAAAVAGVVLIACVNAGAILRTRTTARRRELSIRVALGASRARIGRMVLIEGLMLALAAGALGIAIAGWALGAIAAFPPAVPRFDEVALDVRVLAAAFVVTLLTSVAFAAAPAIQARSAVVFDELRGHAAGARRRSFAARTVIVGSVALAVALLIGSGLLLRTLFGILAIDTGFASDNVLTFRASLSPVALTAPARAAGQPFNVARLAANAYQGFRRRVQALPGVRAVGAAQLLPFGEGQQSGPFAATGRDGVRIDGSADYRVVLPGYFEAVGARLVSGRVFADTDVLATDRRVVIDRTLAERVWPGRDPVGQSISVAVDSNNAGLAPGVVVGVVEQVRAHQVREHGLPQVYLPFGQYNDRLMDLHFVVRSEQEPLTLLPAIGLLFAEVAPGRPLARVSTLARDHARAFADVRFASFALTGFGVVAILVAVTGLYGALSFVVAQRVREIGCRMALGATAGDVQRLFLRDGVALGGLGIAIGLAAAATLTALLQHLLFRVSPLDPLTFVVVGAGALVTVAAASVIPARRAARVDPIVVLRGD